VSYDPYLTLGYAGDFGVKLWRDTGDDSLNFDIGGSPMMTLAANGYLSVSRLVDTGSSSYYVDSASTSHLNGLTTRGYITSGESGSNGSIQVKDGSGTTNVLFSGSGVANSYIDGYNFGIANSSPIATLEVGETLGDSTWALANTWNTRSDVRFKENIVEVDRALEKIASITGYYYNSKTGSDRSRQIGVLSLRK